MGEWSADPWGTDEAADWFHRFWTQGQFSVLIDEIKNFDPKQERYEGIRAASYLLQVLGIAYVWPAEHLGLLRELLERAIRILKNMIDPPSKDWAYLEMSDRPEEFVVAVRDQIAALERRRRDLV
jgi:hypothetical protein